MSTLSSGSQFLRLCAMERTRVARNVLIVVAIAAAVQFLPGGGTAAATFRSVLGVAFATGLAFFAGRLYLEHRTDVYGLGERHRALLYGAVGVGVLTATATRRMWHTGIGELVWFALMGAVAYVLFAVYRFSRAY